MGPIEKEYEAKKAKALLPFHTPYQYVATRIRAIRLNEKLTQEGFAHVIGTNNVSVSNWENAQNRSLPSVGFQYAILRFERRSWMEANWTRQFKWLENPVTRAIYTLLLNGQDIEAQELAAYEVQRSRVDPPSLKTVYLKHIASLAHSVPSSMSDSGGQENAAGLQYAKEAWADLELLPDASKDAGLVAMLRNEELGHDVGSLMNAGPEVRKQEGMRIVDELIDLYQKAKSAGSSMPILNWNALEAACCLRAGDEAIQKALEAVLQCESDGNAVKRRILQFHIYTKARDFLKKKPSKTGNRTKLND